MKNGFPAEFPLVVDIRDRLVRELRIEVPAIRLDVTIVLDHWTLILAPPRKP